MKDRLHDIYRPAEERKKDFREVERDLTAAEIRQQAERCNGCGVPFCHGSGCPLENVVPEVNAAVAAGNYLEAWLILSSASNFPEFTARVCPALCEGACTSGIDGAAVMVRQLEKVVVEKAFELGYVKPFRVEKPSGKSVAVIGSGPAGLTIADELARRNHAVTVFEKNAAPGGLLRYGIPDFKLEKWVIDRRIELMRKSGIKFECTTRIGVDVALEYLQKRFDAVVIAIGTPQPRDLNIPGRKLAGIHFALDFLTGQNRVNAGELKTLPVTAAGKRVVVIGGGDTGSDCVGTALRQRAASVLQIEIMPEPPAARSASTPWPEWPYLLRTSSSHLEGGGRRWSIQTKAFTGRKKLEAVEIVRVEWEFSPFGRPLKFREIPDTAETVPADLVLLALGFTGAAATDALGLNVGERGILEPDPERGIFTVGDCASGASLVVRAMVSGRRAAKEIDACLIPIRSHS
ncbi:MAG: glutamate synthase subunit beta [Victivallaceae bacterium]|nr:glutamate synthase subunit beta [Victivallaceae bacterium]